MIKFLKGTEILNSARKLIAEGNSVDLAVAFWGKGAAQDLKLGQAKGPIRIVCDLLSGGCNPNEIETLRKIPGVTVQALKGLHAKVYLTPRGMMVGSANASANGLGREGKIGTLEAAMFVDDEGELRVADAWFKDVWDRSDEITPAFMKAGKRAWFRQQTPRPTGLTLLQILIDEPTYFEGRVYLTYYFSDASDAAKRVGNDRKDEYFSRRYLAELGDGEPWIYDFDWKYAKSLSIGDSMIHLGNEECIVLTIAGVVRYEEKGRSLGCILLQPANVQGGSRVQGVRMPPRELKVLKDAMKHHIEQQTENARRLGKVLTDEQKDFDCDLARFRFEAPLAYSYVQKHVNRSQT